MGIPQILKNFLNSEKAVASLVPLIIATVFVFTGRITEQEWMDFSMMITGIYVGGKSIHGAAVALGNGKNGKTIADAVAGNDAAADAALEAGFGGNDGEPD